MKSTIKVLLIMCMFLQIFIRADDPCRYTGSKGTIDLTSLGRTDGTPAFPDSTPIGSSYRYSYNPCKPFSEGDTCNDVAVCQISLDGKYTFVLGKQDSASWNPGAGLGASPTISYGFDQKKVIITLECSKDGTSDFEALGESPINTYKFNLKHECACWDGCTGPPPQSNCSINGTVFTSDKQIIQSLPFHVSINPSQSQRSSLNFSYAIVHTNRRVTELFLVSIDRIPSQVFCLSQLKVLSLRDSRNLIIPSEIASLAPSLEAFIVTNISDSLVLPREFFDLINLKSLSIVSSCLLELSDDIAKLQLLAQLTLDNNCFGNLPITLSRLRNLQFLSISGNPLASLDPLSGLSFLKTLNASRCFVGSLPANLSSLQTVDMSRNFLETLDGLEQWAINGVYFTFSYNQIKSISPSSLNYMKGLTYFNLSHNQLTILPDTIYQIENLDTLDISYNHFDGNEREWIEGIFRITNTTIII